MKIIDKIIVSSTAPKEKNVLWVDDDSINIPSKGKWKKASGGGSGGSGIEIVDSIDKLDPNAELGSMASVVTAGSIQETSFRNLYQPDMSMLDQTTGTFTQPELLSSVSSVKVFAPADINNVGFTPVQSMIYLVTRDFSMSVQNMAMIQIEPSAGVMAMTITGGYDTMQQFTLVEFSQDTMSYTVHNDQVEAFNAVLTNGMDWCYFGNPEGVVITEEPFNTLDLFVKAVDGVPSTIDIYVKRDEWEQFIKKELDELYTTVDKQSTTIATLDSKIPTKVSQLENDSEYVTTNMVQRYKYSNYNSIFTVSHNTPTFILDVMPNHYRYWQRNLNSIEESHLYTFLNKNSSLSNISDPNIIHIKEGNPFGLYKVSFVALESADPYPEVYVNEIPLLKGYAYCTFDYKKGDEKISTGSADRSRIYYNGSDAGGSFYPDTINGEEGEYSFLYIIQDIDTNIQGKGSIIYHNTIGDNVKKIELCNVSILYSNAFAAKLLLEEIVFPATLYSISTGAFDGCTSLKELVFNSNIKRLGSCCFEGITCPIIFNETCEFKDVSPFDVYERNHNITFQKDVIISSDSTITNGSMCNCKINGTLYIDTGFGGFYNGTTPLFTFGYSDIEKVVVGENVDEIGGYAFADSNIKEVHIKSLYHWMLVRRDAMNPDKLFLANKVFIEGETPEHIVVPKGITKIENGAFMHLKTLRTVTSNGEITSISYSPFYGCDNLEYIDFSNQTVVPSIEIYKTWTIAKVPHIVPDNLYDEWVAATNWSTIADKIIKKSDWDASQTTE